MPSSRLRTRLSGAKPPLAVAIWIDGRLAGEDDDSNISATILDQNLDNNYFPIPAAMPPINVSAGPHNIRVMLVNPSEVLTDFYEKAGMPQTKGNPTKLQGDDIAHAVQSALEMDDRGFTIELTVFATNPKD